MKHLLSLILTITLAAAAVLAQPTPAETGLWEQEELNVLTRNFSVYFPAAPKVSQSQPTTPIGPISEVSYEAQHFPCVYKVTVVEYPAERAAALSTAKGRAIYAQSLATSMNAKIIGQFDLRPPSLPGHETWLKISGGVLRLQTIAVRNRLYNLMVATQDNATSMLDAPQTRRFFDSFQLTGDWATNAEAEQYRARGWKSYLDAEEGFRLWHPRRLTSAEQFSGQAEAIYGRSYWLAQSPEMVYWAFGYRLARAKQGHPDLEKSLPDLAQLWAEMLDVKIESTTPVVAAGFSGLDCKLSRGSRQGAARILWVKDRFLSAWAWGNTSEANRALARQFAHSLLPYEPAPIPNGAVDFQALDDGTPPPPPPPPPPYPPGWSTTRTTVPTQELLAHLLEKRAGPPQRLPSAVLANAAGIINVNICVSAEGKVLCMGGRDGHPMLRDTATFALAGWKFKPLLVEGKPAFVEGLVPIVFPAAVVRPNEAFESRASQKVWPKYPAAAKSTGVVQVQVSVAGDGKVTAATAFSGPESLRATAEEAARQWSFKPLTIAGERLTTYGILTFNFKPSI